MSFARDLKDFTAAFAAGYKLLDPTDDAYKQAQTEKLRAENDAFDPELEKAYRRSQIEANNSLAAYRSSGGSSAFAGEKGRYGIEPLTAEQMQARDAGYADWAAGVELGYARGGAVPSYRYGGWVDEEWVDREAVPVTQQVSAPAQAIPARTPPMPERAPAAEARPPMPDRSPAPKGAIPNVAESVDRGVSNAATMAAGGEKGPVPTHFDLGPETVAKAVEASKVGLEAVKEQFGVNGAVESPKTVRATEALQKGVNGDPTELAEIDKSLSEATGNDMSKLPESQRNMMRMAYLWDFYTKNSMPKRAAAEAGNLLQTYRVIQNRYAAIAKAAAEEGDVDGAVDAALRAYAYIPDGLDVKIQKAENGYEYSLTDESTGKVVTKKLLTPEEILGRITNYGMSEFDDLVMASGNKDEIALLKEQRSEERQIGREERAEERQIEREERAEERALTKEERAAKRAAEKQAASEAAAIEKEDRAAERGLSKEERAERRARVKALRDAWSEEGLGRSKDTPIKPLSLEEVEAIPDGWYFYNPATDSVLKKRPSKAQQ